MELDLLAPYSREEALSDGVLIDVSEIAKTVGIDCTTLMSAGLWNHRAIACDPKEAAWALSCGKLTWYTTRPGGPPPGEYTQWVDFRNYHEMLNMKIVVERSWESGLLLVTYLHFEERFDFRCPRGPRSSLFLM
jgi:hypothetical protein